ncbi:MAG: Uncharacterised protein [Prochlorococcus marinus str. MIT 9313]|nr:MAG: Uncharacterised protein [Prochlorococcus marinus str. MIT 9313]
MLIQIIELLLCGLNLLFGLTKAVLKQSLLLTPILKILLAEEKFIVDLMIGMKDALQLFLSQLKRFELLSIKEQSSFVLAGLLLLRLQLETSLLEGRFAV